MQGRQLRKPIDITISQNAETISFVDQVKAQKTRMHSSRMCTDRCSGHYKMSVTMEGALSVRGWSACRGDLSLEGICK